MMKLLVIKGITEYYCSITGSYYDDMYEVYLYDGEKPKKTFCSGWFMLNHMPENITKSKKILVESYYTIKDEKFVNAAYPARIEHKDVDNYPESVVNDLYNHNGAYDIVDEKVECEIEMILELDHDLKLESFSFNAASGNYGGNKRYEVTNSKVERQIIDKIAFPSILLYERPGKLSSRDMFNITRAYIKDNIDPKVARITSDYDFCFKVEKIYPLYKPRIEQYKDYSKINKPIKYRAIENKLLEVFNMTSSNDSYKGYNVIPEVYGKNDAELKEKVDNWLKNLIEAINHPVIPCPHCMGVGYVGEGNIPFLTTQAEKMED